MHARRLRRRHIATMARGLVSLTAVVHRWVQRGRAHSSLAEVTPDEHCFARLPTLMVPTLMAMAA